MPDRTWFIGSRRRYGTPHQGMPLQRLDPAEFRQESDTTTMDAAKRREYELEVLERVIEEIRNPAPPPDTDTE
jgi:hypothetical protein